MRIISGKYKGRRIPVARDFPARPTTDFARESLFNVLANQLDFEGLRVLDLFAGTGSIGFEFASRGAAHVEMVEINARSARFLQEVARNLEMENVQVHRADVYRLLKSLTRSYDLVFADPPYQMDRIPEIPGLVLGSSALNSGATFILEHGKDHSFSEHPLLSDARKYGSVRFSIFRP